MGVNSYSLVIPPNVLDRNTTYTATFTVEGDSHTATVTANVSVHVKSRDPTVSVRGSGLYLPTSTVHLIADVFDLSTDNITYTWTITACPMATYLQRIFWEQLDVPISNSSATVTLPHEIVGIFCKQNSSSLQLIRLLGESEKLYIYNYNTYLHHSFDCQQINHIL